jgi:hypothetical protein
VKRRFLFIDYLRSEMKSLRKRACLAERPEVERLREISDVRLASASVRLATRSRSGRYQRMPDCSSIACRYSGLRLYRGRFGWDKMMP